MCTETKQKKTDLVDGLSLVSVRVRLEELREPALDLLAHHLGLDELAQGHPLG